MKKTKQTRKRRDKIFKFICDECLYEFKHLPPKCINCGSFRLTEKVIGYVKYRKEERK